MSVFNNENMNEVDEVDEVAVLKQTIEILKKDLENAKQEVEMLHQTIFEMNNERSYEILSYFNRFSNIKKTANRYRISIEDLYEMIPEWDGNTDGLKSADDYDECRIYIIGRKKWDEEHDPEPDQYELDSRKRTPIREEINKILAEYNSGNYYLYEIADNHDIWINNLFRLLKEYGAILDETCAKGYDVFYMQHLGSKSIWDGKTSLNLIEQFYASGS
jgi:hypothetical protein